MSSNHGAASLQEAQPARARPTVRPALQCILGSVVRIVLLCSPEILALLVVALLFLKKKQIK